MAPLRKHVSLPVLVGLVLSTYWAVAQTADLQHLRDQYVNKVLVVRGFYSGDTLRYDSSGSPAGDVVLGDWTTDAFVQIERIDALGANLKITSKRLMVVAAGRKGFQFAGGPGSKRWKKTKKVTIFIEQLVHDGHDNAATAVLSKIFVSPDDQFADLVPDYWKPCISRGLSGKDQNCQFSTDMAAALGIASPIQTPAPPAWIDPSTMTGLATVKAPIFFNFVGGNVKPPKPTYQPNPSFNEAARKARFQGVVTIGLMVDKDGLAKNVRILRPVGAGLDANAVHAVEGWQFEPAQTDGKPVAVEIVVEVAFHLQ